LLGFLGIPLCRKEYGLKVTMKPDIEGKPNHKVVEKEDLPTKLAKRGADLIEVTC
jgi:hypothetical protein